MGAPEDPRKCVWLMRLLCYFGLSCLFLNLGLNATQSKVFAAQVAYRDPSGQWRLIDEARWPKTPPGAPGANLKIQAPGGAAFSVTYRDVANGMRQGFDDPALGATRRATVNAVLQYLSSVLANTGSCQIEFALSEYGGSGALASGSPFFFTSGGVFQSPFSLRHLTTGSDPSGGVPDCTVTVDFGWNWHYGTGAVPSTKIDLYSVLLHEITHGLGVLTLARSDGMSAFSPNVIFSTWDNLLYSGNGRKLWNSSGVFMGQFPILTGSEGGIQFRGSRARASYGGNFPPVYAPSTFSAGSSISHWAFSATSQGQPVMLPSIGYGVQVRTFRPFEIEALADLGYSVNSSPTPPPTPTPTPTPSPRVTPTPTPRPTATPMPTPRLTPTPTPTPRPTATPTPTPTPKPGPSAARDWLGYR